MKVLIFLTCFGVAIISAGDVKVNSQVPSSVAENEKMAIIAAEIRDTAVISKDSPTVVTGAPAIVELRIKRASPLHKKSFRGRRTLSRRSINRRPRRRSVQRRAAGHQKGVHKRHNKNAFGHRKSQKRVHQKRKEHRRVHKAKKLDPLAALLHL